MKLGFVGGGIMAEALITGIKDAELDAEIKVGEPVAARREALAEVGITAVANNIEAINGASSRMSERSRSATFRSLIFAISVKS